MMAHQRVAGGGAVALHHIEYASRDPGFASSPRRSAVSGDSSDIFSTAVFPSAGHGATFQWRS